MSYSWVQTDQLHELRNGERETLVDVNGLLLADYLEGRGDIVLDTVDKVGLNQLGSSNEAEGKYNEKDEDSSS